MGHLTTEQIEAGMPHVLASPRDRGRLEMIVVRPAEDQRRTPREARCTVDGGVQGDRWTTQGTPASPDAQVTAINGRYLDLIAGSPERWPLSGDQLVVDLNLGDDSLSVGDRLRIGEVLFEVTPKPHNGCHKFRDRFGVDALRYANSPVGKQHHLRGVHLRVVEEGTIQVGDAIVREPARVASAPA